MQLYNGLGWPKSLFHKVLQKNLSQRFVCVCVCVFGCVCVCVCVCVLLLMLFHYRLLQDIEYNFHAADMDGIIQQ